MTKVTVLTEIFDANVSITIRLSLAQTTQRACEERLPSIGHLSSEAHTTSVVTAVACRILAFDDSVATKIVRPPPADAPSPVYPVLVHILSKTKPRASPLLYTHRRRPVSKNSMESCQVQTKGNLRIRRHCELDLEQLAHVMPNLRDEVEALVRWFLCMLKEVANNAAKTINVFDDHFQVFPIRRIILRYFRRIV